jgi:hypothetical protein
MISNFPSAVAIGKTIKFSIDGIKMNYVAGGASIPLELYSVDGNFRKIESYTFYDWISPVSVATLPSSLPYVKVVSSNIVQETGKAITFQKIETGGNVFTPSSMFVIKFPQG